MPRKQYEYHYIYKTTCIINEKYYVGMHSTSNLEDGYLGSGKRLKRSLNKYGKENHKIEILEWLPTRDSLKEREKELVNTELLKDELCINLKEGGIGGFTKSAYILGAKNRGLNNFKNPEFVKKHKERNSKLFKKLWNDGKFKVPDWTGKSHSNKTKEQIGLKNSISQLGEKNSQFGTCWITKDSINKKVKKEDLLHYLEDGWNKGRKNK